MAYNPTTWGSNDVITKDRLNKMEQGIVSASKLSGTDIDTDKDWGGKNITNVGVIRTSDVTCVGTPTSSFSVRHLTRSRRVPTNVLEGNISEWQTAAKFLMPSNVLRGGIRIRAQVKQTYVPGSYSSPKTQILVDGVNVGGLNPDSGTGWKGASKDIYDDDIVGVDR